MSISNLSQLKTAVAAWLDRTDISDHLQNFVTLAEADIRLDVRCQAMEQYASGTLTGETLAHPTRYLDARRLNVDGKQYVYVSPEVYADKSDRNSSERVFTSIGETFYILNASSGDSYTLIYNQAFEGLVSDDAYNWLLTNFPNVYLWASCKQGGIFLEDDGKIAKFTGLYQDAVGRLVSRERAAATSGSPLSMRTAVVER